MKLKFSGESVTKNSYFCQGPRNPGFASSPKNHRWALDVSNSYPNENILFFNMCDNFLQVYLLKWEQII